MSHISELAEKYARHIGLEWLKGQAPAQRVIFLVYDAPDELKARLALADFESSTKATGHGWTLVDVENDFAEWMSSQEYAEAYFESPEDFTADQLDPLADYVAGHIVSEAGAAAKDPGAVVAVIGAGAMFGLAGVHKIVETAAKDIAGRLVVFFPGTCSENHFRLLDGHDGEGYLATVIQA